MAATNAMKAIVISLPCTLEFYGKTLLLKTPCTLVIGLGEIKLLMTRKLLHCWMALIVLEGARKAASLQQP